MMRENPDRSYLPASRSFDIVCGVDITTSLSATIPARFVSFIRPFIIDMRTSVSSLENSSKCCSTRGFVGAIIRTLPSARNSAAVRAAIIVLPRPVGRIRRVSALMHCSTMRV